MPKTIVLIHGAWLTATSWDLVRDRYEAAGHTVVAPPWPCFDRPAAVLRQRPPAAIALGIGNGVRFGSPGRAPLLLITGEADRTVDPAMVRTTYRKYGRTGAVTALRAFPGRPHFIAGVPGWEEAADDAIAWAAAPASVGAG